MPDIRELICQLHKQDGTAPLKDVPGCWNRKLSGGWEFWVNGHAAGPLPHDGTPQGFIVHPFDTYVEFNGWPAGTFSLVTGEGVIAAGACGNYETFCAAVQAELPHASD